MQIFCFVACQNRVCLREKKPLDKISLIEMAGKAGERRIDVYERKIRLGTN